MVQSYSLVVQTLIVAELPAREVIVTLDNILMSLAPRRANNQCKISPITLRPASAARVAVDSDVRVGVLSLLPVGRLAHNDRVRNNYCSILAFGPCTTLTLSILYFIEYFTHVV